MYTKPSTNRPLLRKDTELISPNLESSSKVDTEDKKNEGRQLFEEEHKENPKKKWSFFHRKAKGPRDIMLDGTVNPPNKVKNVIKNQKYNIITFVPIVLFNQFKFFFNLFFLLNALSQFVHALQTGYLITYVGPLALVLLLTMAKEAYDDYERYRRDKQANSAQYKRILRDGQEEMVPSSKLRVGDIIEVKASQRIPADLIILYTTEPTGSVFIKTDQLDGETDWKLRKPITFLQKQKVEIEEEYSYQDSEGCKITVNPPTEEIYKFEGVFTCGDYREALSLENTIWGSTVLATGKIQALVTYTGKEMRVVMNSRDPRSKVGRLDMEINRLSKLLFGVLAALSLGLVALAGFEGEWYVHFFRFIILLSYIIPISLRVNLDFAKLFYSYQINHDKDIEGCIARNRDIPEELGRIQFLLSDKTGTLTQNEMVFKKISLENGTVFTPEKKHEIVKYLKKNCEKYNGPLGDIEEKVKGLADQADKKKKRLFRREKDCLVRDLISALVLCHNVTPVDDNGSRVLQASSPDEIALVEMTRSSYEVERSRSKQNYY